MSAALQPGQGVVLGRHYLPSRVEEIRWGWLPNAAAEAVLEVGAGETVTIDTVSHEGLLEDQGRDPRAYLAQFGVDEVLEDVVDIAASTVSNRHGFGALAGEFPEDDDSTPTRHVDRMVSMGTVSHFSRVAQVDGRDVGRIDAGRGRHVQFPLNPFLGLMGTAVATTDAVPSVPPGDHGGNIDIRHTGVGSTLYLPVLVDGALFYAGDPHFAQGNGEVALTALEASLRATLRLSVIPAADRAGVLGPLTNPVVETATHWIPTGMDADLDEAMRKAVRHAVAFLHGRFDVPRSVALAYLSAAGDFEVSQVVDAVKGVHCMIAKADWTTWH